MSVESCKDFLLGHHNTDQGQMQNRYLTHQYLLLESPYHASERGKKRRKKKKKKGKLKLWKNTLERQFLLRLTALCN